MVLTLDEAFTACTLLDASYSFAQTGTCQLGAGWSAPQAIVALGHYSTLLQLDGLKTWGFVTEKDKRQWVVLRGTQTWQEWLADATALPMEQAFGGYVHRGFYEAYEDIRPSLASLGLGTNAIFTGHSLGGPLATMAALDFGSHPLNVITLESPKIGDRAFAMQLGGSWRIVNSHDAVPDMPLGFGFTHGSTAQELYVSGKWDALDIKVAHKISSVVSGLDKISTDILNV